MKLRLAKHFRFFVIVILMIGLFSCSSKKEILIGVVLPLSGSHAAKGKSMLRAVEMYFDEVNSKNLINNQTVKLVIEDDKNTAEGAKTAAQKIVSNRNIIAVIGHYYSSALAGAAEIYNSAGIPVISPFASNSVIARSKWLFSINIGDERQGEYMAVYLNKILQKDNIVVINTNEMYGEGLKKGFISKAEKLGVKIIKQLSFDQSAGVSDDFIASHFNNQNDIKKINSIVLLTHSADGLKLLKQIRDKGITCEVIGPNTFSSNVFLKNIPESYTKHVYVTAPFLWEIASEKAFHFSQKYKNKFNEQPDIVSPMAYDAALMLGKAIIAKGTNREKIREHWLSLKWQTAIDGLTGNLHFEPSRRMDRDVYMSEIKDGRFKVAYTQITIPKEPYVYKQLKERVKKGYLMIADNIPYHIVDVVFVGVDIIRINDANTRDMTFDAELFIWFKWMGKSLDINDFTMLNGVSIKQAVLIKEDTSKAVKYKCTRLKVTYYTDYNLSNYPFDAQVLKVNLAHKNKNSSHVMLAIDSRHMTREPIREIYPQEWVYTGRTNYSSLYRYESTFGDSDYRMSTGYKSRIYFASVNFNIYIKRILTPYYFSLFLPLFVIIGITMILSAISLDQFMMRLNAGMSSLLGLIVYHLSQKSVMPKVGYLMKADLFFIFSYIFMLCLIISMLIIHRMLVKEKKEKAKKFNRYYTSIAIPLAITVYVLLLIIH